MKDPVVDKIVAHLARVAAGAGNVIPANISDLCELIAGGHPRIDVVLLQVSGPDAAGNYNAGIGIECLREMIAGARLVIAQLNPALPWTEGDTMTAGGLIDIVVPATHPVLELPAPPAKNRRPSPPPPNAVTVTLE